MLAEYQRNMFSFHEQSIYGVFLDNDYLSFLETLKQEVEPLPSAEMYLEQQEANKQSMKGVFSAATVVVEVKQYAPKHSLLLHSFTSIKM